MISRSIILNRNTCASVIRDSLLNISTFFAGSSNSFSHTQHIYCSLFRILCSEWTNNWINLKNHHTSPYPNPLSHPHRLHTHQSLSSATPFSCYLKLHYFWLYLSLPLSTSVITYLLFYHARSTYSEPWSLIRCPAGIHRTYTSCPL